MYLLFEGGRKDDKPNTMSPHFSSKKAGDSKSKAIGSLFLQGDCKTRKDKKDCIQKQIPTQNPDKQ